MAASNSSGSAPEGGVDLSRQIESEVSRRPLERVSCVRVFGNYYRCNWWSPQTDSRGEPGEGRMRWGTTTTHYIRASSFLHAVIEEGRLVIREDAQPGDARTNSGEEDSGEAERGKPGGAQPPGQISQEAGAQIGQGDEETQ